MLKAFCLMTANDRKMVIIVLLAISKNTPFKSCKAKSPPITRSFLIPECDYELTTGIQEETADGGIQRATNDDYIDYLSLYERCRLC